MVWPPAVAGIDDDAGGEGVAGRCGDEGVEVGLPYLCAGRMALALDGTEAAPALLGHEVDARIGAVEIRSCGGPFGPEPDVGETFAVERVVEEIRLHQPLEEAPLLRLGVGDGPEVVQRSLEAAAQGSGSSIFGARRCRCGSGFFRRGQRFNLDHCFVGIRETC